MPRWSVRPPRSSANTASGMASNRDQRRRYEIPQCVDCDRCDEQSRPAKIRECPRVHLVSIVMMRLSSDRRWQKKRHEHQSRTVR